MKGLNQNSKIASAVLLSVILGSYLYSSSAHAEAAENISKVNSSVRVDANDNVGDVSSVNGGIEIGRDSHARELSSVNGRITLNDGASIEDAETVNGGIRVGENVTVEGSLSTVNGGVRTETGTQVDGNISTVNGTIRLQDTVVKKDLETSRGDIVLRQGSIVEGDLVVSSKKRWWNSLFNSNRSKPEIEIDATSIVRGDIHLYREVDLNISPDAQVGEVITHY